MLCRLLKENVTLYKEKVRALPRRIMVGDFFTGTGAFAKVTAEVIEAMKAFCPSESEDLDVLWQLT